MLPIQRPITNEFALVYEYDDAVERPSFADLDGEALVAAQRAWAERWNRAVETLQFDELFRPGAQPTRFVFRPLSADDLYRIQEIADSGRKAAAAARVAFRLALRRVENGGDLLADLKRERDQEYPQFRALLSRSQTEICDFIPVHVGQLFGHLVNELGSAAFLRSSSPPKF